MPIARGVSLAERPCQLPPVAFLLTLKKGVEEMEKQAVPIWEKANLTIEEAAAYFGIGTNKLREITSNPDCGFVIWIGTKRLIKRKKFEKYLEDVDTL